MTIHDTMAVLPRRIYLFDDDEWERGIRSRDVERAVRIIVNDAMEQTAPGGADLVIPEVVSTGSRQRLFELLDDEHSNCIVIADLASHSGYDIGWIGARILRSIAEDPEMGRRCWRIALSKFATAEIATELSGHAHAIVKDRARDVDRHLASAIATVMGHPPARTVAITQHPATQDRTDWDGALRDHVQKLVGLDSRRGDEFILLGLIKNVPANVIEQELERELAAEGGAPEERRMSVNDFLRAVEGNRGEPSTAGVHRLISETSAMLKARTIHQSLNPDAVDRARKVIAEVLAFDAAPHRRHRLPEDRYQLGREFVVRYSELAPSTANATTKRVIALRKALEDPRFSADREILQFAVWSLSDVIRAEAG